MPPFLGQGMCSGMRDAQNLAFKLDLLLSGRVQEAILDTYQSEREPHVAAVVHKGIELGKVQTMRDPRKARERDLQYLENRRKNMKPDKLRFPGLGPGLISATAHPANGRLFIQDQVRTETATGRFDEVFGYGFKLLSRRENGSNVSVIDPDTGVMLGSFADVSGNYLKWFEENDCQAVLVRPDFYIYGAARTDREYQELLREYSDACSTAGSGAQTVGV
jgi:3-(3-hydroxy-phenyl)propionate hydroxylase/flavoprotein hydroxylase